MFTGFGHFSPQRKSIMAQTPTNTPATMSNLDKVLQALRTQPQATMSELGKLVIAAAKAEGFDYSNATAGKKAAFTRRVKDAVKSSGISL
jgi:hypothetical protein